MDAFRPNSIAHHHAQWENRRAEYADAMITDEDYHSILKSGYASNSHITLDEFVQSPQDALISVLTTAHSEIQLEEPTSFPFGNNELSIVASSFLWEDPPSPASSETPPIEKQSVSSPPAQVFSRSDPAKPRPRRRIDPREWDEKRHVITVLYQNNSLSETRKVMQDEHQFFASEKGYKDKIKEWGLRKNIRKMEALSMIRKADERKLQEDKKTIFRYRGGIEIPSTKLERFNKAAKVELSEISYGSIPSDITFYTPRNSASPRSSQSPCGSPPSRQIYQHLQSSTQIQPPAVKESSSPGPKTTTSLDQLRWIEVDGSLHKRSDFHELLGEGSIFHRRQISYFTRICKDGISSCTNDLISDHERLLLDSTMTHLERTPENAEFPLRSLAVSWNRQYGTAHTKTLSSFFCLAAYYLAQGQFQTSEKLLDRVLMGLQYIYGVDSIEAIRHSSRCIQLQTRIHVINGNFWALQKLMICRIKDITRVCGPDDPQLLDLQQILLLTKVNGFEVDEQGETLATDMLTELNRTSTDMEMTLTILELLRYRYHRINDYSRLSSLLPQIEQALQFAGHFEPKFPRLIFYTGYMLVLSYRKLQRHKDCERLLDLMIFLAGRFYGTNSPERSRQSVLCMMLRQDQAQRQIPDPVPLCQSFLMHENMDKMSSEHPLFIALTKCLRDELLD